MVTIPFQPNPTAAPPFATLVTLDGQVYLLVAMWSIARSDWYIALYDQNETLIANQPLVGSPPNVAIPLFPSANFRSSILSYSVSTGSFIQNP